MYIEIVSMKETHLDDVLRIEEDSFPDPWSLRSFHREIMENPYAHYFAALNSSKVIGYIGGWVIIDELHITNLAVDPLYRRKGIARKLLNRLTVRAKQEGSLRVTLEVRVSNSSAIALYKKYGFIPVGCRPKYYTNDHEDALIMWKEIIDEGE